MTTEDTHPREDDNDGLGDRINPVPETGPHEIDESPVPDPEQNGDADDVPEAD
jgi:hypothetical protein